MFHHVARCFTLFHLNLGVLVEIPKHWMTIDEYCKRLEISRTTLWRWAKKKVVKVWKRGRFILIHEREIKKFEEFNG